VHDRLGRQRRARDDVGVANGALEVRGCGGVKAVALQLLGG
jgi:hypothetical protein